MFLGIDIGTTAIKFAVIEQEKIKYQQTIPVTTHREVSGACYQKTDELLRVLQIGVQSIPKDMRSHIAKVSFSVAMHSVWPQPDEKVFIWSDTQAEQLMADFKKDPLAQKFYEKTGTPIHAMSPFAKLLYFERSKIYPPQTRYYGIKELVMHYFTEQYVIDYATATATGLFDNQQLIWDAEILAYVGIQEEQLAAAVDTTTEFPLTAAAAEALKLPLAAKVAIGASDGCLAAFASYTVTKIPNSLTIGTSASVRKVTRQPIFQPVKQNFCYYLNREYYVIGAPSNNGGCVLEWASRIYADTPAEFFVALPENLQASVIGAQQLQFHPFINGERAPLWQSEVTGTLKNLTIRHTKADLIRSVVEGILLNIRTLTEMVAISGELSLSGGFFKSPVLQQLTADILGVDCYLSAYNEPVMGLYYLIYGSQTDRELPVEKIASDPQNYQAYTDVFTNYFDD